MVADKVSRILLLLCTACAMLMGTPLLAEQRWAEVEFDEVLEPASLSAILFSNGDSIQILDARISSSDHGKTIVAIPFDSNIVHQAQYFAYAIAKTADGKMHYSSVVPASPQYDIASGYAQPMCIPREVPQSMQSQMSLVANLLKVRDKRRANMRAQTKKLLSGEFLDKMLKYESGFGLQYGRPLSADMPAAQIVDRLDRILHTLRKVSSKR